MKNIKLLIVGSRSITDFDPAPYIPKEVDLIITGGAKGIDCIAEKYADDHNISKLILRPKYARFGRGAPLKRNEEMVNIADSAIVVWDGVSKGAEYTIGYCKRKNKPITVIFSEPSNKKSPLTNKKRFMGISFYNKYRVKNGSLV